MADRHGTVSRTDGGWIIRFERRLRQSVQAVWNVIVGPDQMSRWFNRTEMPPELKPGLMICFFHDRAGLESLGLITAADPLRLIEWEWNGPIGAASVMRWEIHPETDGCRLIMTQTIAERGALARTVTGWHACLDRMEQVLEGRPTPEGLSAWKLLFEHYVRALADLAADAQVRRADDMIEACFDRTLPRPIDRVWEAFTSGDKTVDLAAGVVEFRPRPGEAASRPRIASYEPPQRLGAIWPNHGAFSLRLNDLGGATQMVLIHHEPAGAAHMAAHIAEWHASLDRMEDRLAERPERTSDLRALEDKYARALSAAA